jgi:hypothetical protein
MHHRHIEWAAMLAAIIMVGASCSDSDACTSGTEGCVCQDGACNDGLECSAGVCVGTTASTGGSTGAGGSTASGGSTSTGGSGPKPLTPWEDDVVGTWYYYSSSYSEYRCITFNADRTACYFEVSSLSSSNKGNKKCYTDWYVDSELTGSVYAVNYIGDNTGGKYWAGYQWNTSQGTLESYDGVDQTRTQTISCDFCP